MTIGARFVFFLATSSLSTLSLHCVRFGVSWWVMRETGSAIAFASIVGVSSLVEVYSKPLLAPLADDFDRLAVYRACIGAASVFMLALLAALLLLPFSAALLASLLIALSLVAGLRDPAAAGLVPALVTADRLMQAQSLRSTLGAVASLGAPMLSALLLVAGGTRAALAGAAVFSLLALLGACGVRMHRQQSAEHRWRWSTYASTWHLQTVDGLRAVLWTRAERTTAVVVALTNAGLYPFFFLVLPLWVTRDLGASARTMAALEMAFGAGILAGSLAIARWANARVGRFSALVLGNGLLGSGLLAAAFLSHPAALAACFVAGGVGFAIFNINANTLRSAATPKAFRSRMAAGVAFLSSCLNPFAAQCMGFVVAGSSGATGVVCCGALILVSTALLLGNADAKALLACSDGEVAGAYARLYPRAFFNRQDAPRT